MQKRKLGRTGLEVTPVSFGGAPLVYVNEASGWDPRTDAGRARAVATIHHVLDRGINYIDTAALYGDGVSETLIGEVMKTRRKECVLATKAWFELDAQGVIDSAHASMKRLQTDYIDVMQIHGRMYTHAEQQHVVRKGGPLDGMRTLKKQGRIGFIGLTTEEAWSAMPFLAVDEIDVYQIAYNIIYQNAALHFLEEAHKKDVGVVTMRTMTSGFLQRQARYLAPEWSEDRLYEISLQFVLSDSRVHSAISGMRFSHEVDRNIEIATQWKPPIDFAVIPRTSVGLYQFEDAEAKKKG